MARSLNKVILIGHLGADPALKELDNGNHVCNFRLATSESWKDKQSGDRKERSEWHSVVIYGRLAEIADDYARKGTLVYFEGTLRRANGRTRTGPTATRRRSS
jgi:single-strand DNA-binding protein